MVVLMKTREVIDHIVLWMREYQQQSFTNGFVVGISGGIDSAVTSTLVALTGSPVTCVEMPIHQDPSQDIRAKKHIDALKQAYPNVSSTRIDLTPVYDQFVDAIPSMGSEDNVNLSLANSRARLRMTSLYYVAGANGYLVAGTGNKVEDFGVGFYTKYGDGGVDLSPIADLLKTEVFEVAKELDVIEEIQLAQPTDGLWGDSRTDEDQLGASYPELEWAMMYEEQSSLETLSPRQAEVLAIYRRLNNANQHKMNPIPVCNIPSQLKFE